VCSSDSFFSIKEVDLGIVADLGTLNNLRSFIKNENVYRELVYTGRRFNADEAYKIGMVLKVVNTFDDLMRFGNELAQNIGSKSPMCIYGIKQALDLEKVEINEKDMRAIAMRNAYMLIGDDVQKSGMAMISGDKNIKFAKL